MCSGQSARTERDSQDAWASAARISFKFFFSIETTPFPSTRINETWSRVTLGFELKFESRTSDQSWGGRRLAPVGHLYVQGKLVYFLPAEFDVFSREKMGIQMLCSYIRDLDSFFLIFSIKHFVLTSEKFS